jgi:glycosyltransferase involved in cell wall biosynthesis
VRRPLRLVVDDSAAFNQGAGIGRYARNIVPAAVRFLESSDVTLWYAAEGAQPPQFEEATLSAFFDLATPRVRRGRLSRRRMDQLWYRARLPLPLQLLAGAADVVYSPDFTVPPAPGVPRIMTVHDLAFLVTPERTSAPLRRYLSAVVPRQIEKADHVIAVSESTKRDLINVLEVDPTKISVVTNGVDDRFMGATPLSEMERRSLGVPEKYLLTVGTLEPRKNHLNLFEAIEHFSPGLDFPLVVAGRKGWDYEPILTAASPLVQAGRVILVDYVPENLLPGLYTGAASFIYPSWYEGF